MAQTTDYSKVDLRVGTEAQFNAKVDTLPAGTLFGITDATVSKADLSTDLKNEINGKINKPANPTSDSAITINSSGTISTKPLSDIAGKSEVAVQSTTPTGDEILWINPNGTSGGGGSSGGGKLYMHRIRLTDNEASKYVSFYTYNTSSTPLVSYTQLHKYILEGLIVRVTDRGVAAVSNANPLGFGIAGVLKTTNGVEYFLDMSFMKWESLSYTDDVFEV